MKWRVCSRWVRGQLESAQAHVLHVRVELLLVLMMLALHVGHVHRVWDDNSKEAGNAVCGQQSWDSSMCTQRDTVKRGGGLPHGIACRTQLHAKATATKGQVKDHQLGVPALLQVARLLRLFLSHIPGLQPHVLASCGQFTK